jgi:hypothetical protein
MPYWIYSHEALPNPDLMGKPGYTPDAEYIRHGGFTLAFLPAKTWTKLPDISRTIRHRDWTDRKGTPEAIHMEDIVKPLTEKFEKRGVVLLDHEPDAKEKAVYELKSENASRAFMMSQVEWYEGQVREKEVTGHGRTKPTPYEDLCYSFLELTKPYSVEAMRAQRHPGEAVGEQIVAALDRLDKRRAEQQQEAKNEKASHTKPVPVPAP